MLTLDVYKRQMQPYLTELNRQKIREITLSEKQLRPFYGSVLKHLEAHTDFHTEGVDLTDYEPPEAHFSIYLDNPAENIISCTAVSYTHLSIRTGTHHDAMFRKCPQRIQPLTSLAKNIFQVFIRFLRPIYKCALYRPVSYTHLSWIEQRLPFSVCA